MLSIIKKDAFQRILHGVILIIISVLLRKTIRNSLRIKVKDLHQIEVWPFLFYCCNIVLLQLKILQPDALEGKNISYQNVPRNKEEKGGSQQLSYRSNYHQNQHFPLTHTNIRIIEITPSLWARDSGKRLCVHSRMFDKTYHFMKILFISCMILTMSMCSLRFPRFLRQKWKWRRAVSGLFPIQPRDPPPAHGFRNSFSLWRFVIK